MILSRLKARTAVYSRFWHTTIELSYDDIEVEIGFGSSSKKLKTLAAQGLTLSGAVITSASWMSERFRRCRQIERGIVDILHGKRSDAVESSY